MYITVYLLTLCSRTDDHYHFVYGDPSPRFICSITGDLLLVPHQTSCCGQMLSEAAIARLETKPCPFCSHKEIKTLLDKHFQREIRELQVFCRHRNRGCEWTGEVSSLESHTKSCSKINSPLIQQLGNVCCYYETLTICCCISVGESKAPLVLFCHPYIPFI